MGPQREAAIAGRDRGVDPDALLRAYLLELRAYPLLTRDEEARLGRLIQDGAEASRELDGGAPMEPGRRRELEARVAEGRLATRQFVQSNLRLVVSIAKGYRSPALTLLDLIQEGNLGLMHAVARFDHHRGFKFSTYARYWIRQAITKAVAENGQPMRVPVQVMAVVWRVRRTQARLATERGRSPSVGEVAAELELAPEQVTKLLSYVNEPRSFSEPLGLDEGCELGEMLSDPLARSPYDELAAALLPRTVASLLSVLDEREQDVIRLHFGLGGVKPRTLAEIGASYSLTRERIRQIESRAFEKLRAPAGREAIVALELASR